MSDSNVKLTVSISDSEMDEEELDQFTRNLVREIRELDVDKVELVAVEDIPEGAKSLTSSLLGIFMTETTKEGVKGIFGFLSTRLNRTKTIELEVEANSKKLKVKASNQEDFTFAIEEAKRFIESAEGDQWSKLLY